MTSPFSPSRSSRNVAAGPNLPPAVGGDGDQSPLLEHHSFRNHNKRASQTFRQVQRVSKRAALASKRKIWDSNDASIDAAQTAVDHWENTYTALRGLLVASAHSAQRLYGAAKTGANGLEHGLLVPVRDWILLPTFWGVERAAGETICFLQSPQAAQVADASLDVVRRIPFVGDNLVAPALLKGVDLAKTAWHVAQYPIPSKSAVRDSVDCVMTGTKWALSTTWREIYFYAKIVDANITRTLMHTQWKILGSGPYATLDKINKGEVIDHLCERYFSLEDVIHRYEFAAHIRAHNPMLYHDLVLTGLLRDRGGDLTEDDEWLSPCPSYRSGNNPFLLPETDSEDYSSEISSLWFRLPYVNGQRPSKDVPWDHLPEGNKLETRYLAVVAGARSERDHGERLEGSEGENVATHPFVSEPVYPPRSASATPNAETTRYPTIAKWYEPNTGQDVFVDQRRHAVSFLACCPKCRTEHGDWRIPLVQNRLGSLCSSCQASDGPTAPLDTLILPPPVKMIMRPTMWRFHGPGDEVRRAVWFLDTKHGLQPYSEESAAVLEDAYLFLKWKGSNQASTKKNGLDGELLTVEVSSPNGAETQLVQFRSLTQVTAIQKTLGGAISLFKRRVYRGATAVEALDTSGNVGKNSFESVIPVVEGEVSPSPANLEQEMTADEADETFDTESVDLSKAATAADSKDMDKTFESDSVVSVAADVDETPIDPALSLAIPTSLVTGGEEVDGGEDSIDHLVLVVHGIGEMLRTIDLFGMSLPTLSSIVDCCRYLRTNHAQIHAAHSTDADGTRECKVGRVEYLPVEWHEAFAIQSQRQASPDLSNVSLRRGMRSSPNTTMNDISLRTIPQMRTFANDTLLDVLYFMSPEHHDKIIDIVTNEANFLVGKFRSLTGFSGKISVIGHSLGSVISWDILANQVTPSSTPPTYEPTSPFMPVFGQSPAISPSFSNLSRSPPATTLPAPPTKLPAHGESSSQFSGSDSGFPESSHPLRVNWQDSMYPQLSFEVQNAFMLGSPIPVFLMIRNQHKPLSENFYLAGCRRVFNVFHPYDPVAYRIEPLLDPRNADIEPRIIPHWNGGFRVHYQTKMLWKKLVDETWKTQQNVINTLEASMAGLGLLDAPDVVFEDEEELSETSSDDNRLDYVNCGMLNQGLRIDYMLQEKEIENANEYVAALAAHSSYWMEKDFSLFVARQIYRSQNDALHSHSSHGLPTSPPTESVDL